MNSKIKLMAAKNKAKWEALREANRLYAAKEFPALKRNGLFIAGLMLYSGEGDNNPLSPHVRISNTDPRIMRLFLKFAYEICKIPKEQVRVNLVIYPDISKVECEKFWSNYLKVPLRQFYKTQVIKGRHPTKRLGRGVCMIRIGSANLKLKFITWINLFFEYSFAGIV